MKTEISHSCKDLWSAMKKQVRTTLCYVKSLYAVHHGCSRGYSREVEEKLLSDYQGSAKKDAKQGVIMMFDGKCVQGGLTDRLRGITSMYSLCKEYNIPFYLSFTHPFHIEDYLEPNRVNWRINKEQISYNMDQTKLIVLYDFDYYPTLHETLIKKRICGKTQYHLYTNSKFRDRDFRWAFGELFRPSDLLQNQIDYCLKDMGGGEFISISFRFTTLLGDFDDCINKPLPINEQNKLISNCIKAIEQIHKQNKEYEKVLITADSQKFIDCAKQLDYVYVVPGDIGHFDHSKGKNESVEMKTFLDFFLISKASRVYLVRLGKMYNSGFCRHAAMLGEKPFTLFEG